MNKEKQTCKLKGVNVMCGTHLSSRNSWVAPIKTVVCCFTQDPVAIIVKLAATASHRTPSFQCNCYTKYEEESLLSLRTQKCTADISPRTQLNCKRLLLSLHHILFLTDEARVFFFFVHRPAIVNRSGR